MVANRGEELRFSFLQYRQPPSVSDASAAAISYGRRLGIVVTGFAVVLAVAVWSSVLLAGAAAGIAAGLTVCALVCGLFRQRRLRSRRSVTPRDA
jgi:Flp pilus assembly protein TadB